MPSLAIPDCDARSQRGNNREGGLPGLLAQPRGVEALMDGLRRYSRSTTWV